MSSAEPIHHNVGTYTDATDDPIHFVAIVRRNTAHVDLDHRTPPRQVREIARWLQGYGRQLEQQAQREIDHG